MRSTLYDDWDSMSSYFLPVRPEHVTRGRYWHMRNEHAILEDYDLGGRITGSYVSATSAVQEAGVPRRDG